MYMYPTVTALSKYSPVLPSLSLSLPVSEYPQSTNSSRISFSDAPSNTGVAMYQPFVFAARPR